MPVKLHPLISALLPPARGIRLLEASIEDTSVRLQLTVAAPTAASPAAAAKAARLNDH